MNTLYTDLYNEIISFCDKNTKYNLKLTNKKFNSLISNIYENKIDFYQNLIIELDDVTTIFYEHHNYVPIIYRLKSKLDEYFIIACGILLYDKQCYDLIKTQIIRNLKYERDSKLPDDLFQMELKTKFGLKIIRFSTIKLLEIVNKLNKTKCEKAIYGIHKLVNFCEICSKNTGGFRRGQVIPQHPCTKITPPLIDEDQNWHKSRFFWSPDSYFYFNSICQFENIYNILQLRSNLNFT